jgi:hypothetical protein
MLQDSERAAKAAAPLPYAEAQTGGILYEPDAADDIDEDDPDADLMI